MDYLKEIQDDNIDVLGIDWRMNITEALNTLGNDYRIQGNIDPSLLFMPWNELEENSLPYGKEFEPSNVSGDHWIMGLRHGVLPKTRVQC